MPYSSMNTGSGLIHQYLGEAFPKLLSLYERLPEIMEVYDSIHNSITSNFNLQAQAYIYNTVGTSFIYSPFIVGTTTESSLVYSISADRNAASWTIDPATGVIEKTMLTADVGTTVLTITVVDSSINETRTSVINIVTFKDVSSIQDPIEISLNGSQYIEVTEDTVWVDPGVTYNVAAETTDSVGTVDTATPGVYVINYTASAQGITAKATRVVKVVSNVPLAPTRSKVDLVGDNPMLINWSGFWSDPGVTSEDSISVTTTGSVDVQVPGVYIITYTATATSGDTVSIERVVIVGEKYESQVVVPENVLVAIPQNTPTGITLTNNGLNDATLMEIVSPPMYGNISSINSTTAIYVPSTDFRGNDSFTFRVSTPDSSENAVGTAYILVGLGTVSSSISLLSSEDVSSYVIAVDPGDLTYSISKGTVSGMIPTGFSLLEIDQTLIVSQSGITATVTETITSYDISWSEEFLGVVRFRVRFGDSIQSYWTEVILDISEAAGTLATDNPLDQIITTAFIELTGDASSVDISTTLDVVTGTDARITEVLNNAGSIGTATTDNAQGISYTIPNGSTDVTESFLIRITDMPNEELTQLRNITAVFKAFNSNAPTITMIADYNTEITYTPAVGDIITNVSSAANGTSSITSNVIKYIPNTGYTGTDSFTYIMDDGSQGEVNVYVADYNGQFKINNYFQPCNYQTLISFDPFVNDNAANPLFVTNTAPTNGAVSKNGTVFTYVPNASFVGSDSFTYQMQNLDNPSQTDTATVWIEVLPDGAAAVTSNTANTPPVLTLNGDNPTGIFKTEESEIVILSTTVSTWTGNSFLHLGDAGIAFEISIPIQTQALLIGASPAGTDFTSDMAGKWLINGQNTDYSYDGNAFNASLHLVPPGTWDISYCRTGLRRDSSGNMEFFLTAPDNTESTVAVGNTTGQLDFVVWDHLDNTGRDAKGLRLNGVLVDSTVIGNAQTTNANDYDISGVPTIAGTVSTYALFPLTGDVGTTISNTRIGEDGTLIDGSLDANGAPIFNNAAYIDFTNLRIPNSNYTLTAKFNMSVLPTDTYPGFNQVIIASRSVGDYGLMLVCSRSWDGVNTPYTILDVALTDPNVINKIVLFQQLVEITTGVEYSARVVDKNNVITVYLNDMVVKVVSYDGTFDNSNGLMISREPRAADYYFQGTIKDVSISSYADDGVVATDTEDVVIHAVNRTGDVDPTLPGSYNLVYDVTDSGGLTDSITKTVYVT